MVTAIIAVVAAVAAPRYATMLHRYRADTAARSIVAELGKARAFARQSSEAHRVQFDLTGHRLILPDQPTDHSGLRPAVWLERPPYEASFVSVTLDDDASEIVFDGHGQPSVGGVIVIRSGQTTRTITLHPLSGQASFD
ncbi:MAG: hypothetical protein WDZ31_11860 [Phycisphaeraceae bacterium]